MDPVYTPLNLYGDIFNSFSSWFIVSEIIRPAKFLVNLFAVNFIHVLVLLFEIYE